ncbi:aspartyl/asparaginyl beta-hydroxylase domain-containing protein [Chitinolyticbacter meiyuanensis]|uniref:aspartyl/asparaginyl beta-hydroxylase domain-containing protein n=1 Tax=Chitinolyticbacter meiyuanensis TaxID=682798 RepID=UPI0011E5ED00|nr:aspartyl/asparaginyl beta-hydroxylase domain-containing protein [Chitinolyticbacter meiyuanensis]
MPALPLCSRLPLSFDPAQLASLLAAVPEAAWHAHFNTGNYVGGWSGAALVAPAQAPTPLAPPGRDETVIETALLRAQPGWRAVLAALPGTARSARLLKLAPGSRILEHADPDLGDADGDLRLHIPLQTDDAVEFCVAGRAIPMRVGECWMLDLSLPHRVDNASPRDRVHLVVDVRRGPALLAAIAAGLAGTPAPQPARGERELARFRDAVLADPARMRALAELTDPSAFRVAVLGEAAAMDYHFGEDDLAAAMRRGRRDWMTQWIV